MKNSDDEGDFAVKDKDGKDIIDVLGPNGMFGAISSFTNNQQLYDVVSDTPFTSVFQIPMNEFKEFLYVNDVKTQL